MGIRRVLAPDGRTWVVRRHWAPRLGTDTLWSRFRKRMKGTIRRSQRLGDGLDSVPDGCVDLDDLLILLVIIAVVLLAVFVVIPLLVALVDLLILLLLAGLGVLGRVVFRRPWIIEARASDGTRHTWKVVGWRAGEARRDEIAQQLAAGITPTADV